MISKQTVSIVVLMILTSLFTQVASEADPPLHPTRDTTPPQVSLPTQVMVVSSKSEYLQTFDETHCSWTDYTGTEYPDAWYTGVCELFVLDVADA